MSLNERIEFEDNGRRYQVQRESIGYNNLNSIFPVPKKVYTVISSPTDSTDWTSFEITTYNPSVKGTDLKILKRYLRIIGKQTKFRIKRLLKRFKLRFFPNSL